MSWMLCLDASTPRTCVALGRLSGGERDDAELVVADEEEDGANQSSERLHLRLAAALERAGIGVGELEALACGRGPGTFTGSRVAVATAKGLALGLALPVVPVSTLAALAASAGVDGRVLALLDARRKQVYGAVYELQGGAPTRASEERVTELAELLAGLDALDDLQPFGPGCGPYAEQLPEELRERSVLAPGPSAAGLWAAAVHARRAGAAVDAGELRVSYLRQSYAEMGINKPKRPVFRSPFV